MNKLYLSMNLTPLGSLALGVIAATGIAMAPAQAVTFSGELEWGDATSDFFDDVFEGGSTFTDFQVNFNPGQLADTFDTQGNAFTPNPLTFAAPDSPRLLNSPVTTGFFTLVGDGSGLTANYVLAQDLVFTVEDNAIPNGLVEIVFQAGDEFLAAKDIDTNIVDPIDQIVGVDLEETTSNAIVRVDKNGDGDFNDPEDLEFIGINGEAEEILTFGILDGAEFGEYGAETIVSKEIDMDQVPEPATILGLLTVGALGLSLKRKKQS